MKQRYRLYRRSNGGRFYIHDKETGKQKSLGTSDPDEAARIVHAQNESERHPTLNIQIARAYLAASDSLVDSRTWQDVMDHILTCKEGSTLHRWQRAIKDKAFDELRTISLLKTRPEHFLHAMQVGTVSTNFNLRLLHNFALDMGWLPWPVLPKKQWPKLKFKEKRAITEREHQALVDSTHDAEWKAFLELAWHIGAAQGDLAALQAENVDLKNRVLNYTRQKTGSFAVQRVGDKVADLLKGLPRTGPLFPKLSTKRTTYRSTRFAKHCKRNGISGVTLHSYRYAWAERAKRAGYPERFAQEALGHNSQAVHRAYARMARVDLPALEDFEAVTPKVES